MTKVLFILHRTDLAPTVHDFQFLAQTQVETLGNWYTTSDLRSAKRFTTETKALAFLSRTAPTNDFGKFLSDNGSIACYKLLCMDLETARGNPKGLKTLPVEALRALGTIWYCATRERLKPAH